MNLFPSVQRVELHVPPQTVVYDLRVCGNLVELSETWNWNQAPRGKRGACLELFTRASRLRMLKQLAQINWKERIRYTLITLTYTDSHFIRDFKQHTIDRSRFVRDLEEHVGRPLSILWRKEWQPRKSGIHRGRLAPHWHLLCWNTPWIDWKAVRGIWQRCLGTGENVATHIKEAPNGEKAAFYASKYCAKASSCTLDNVSYLNRRWGRAWGFLRQAGICYYEPKIIRGLTADEFRLAKNLGASEWQGIERGSDQGFTLFSKHAEAIYRSVLKMRLAKAKKGG